MDLKLMVFLVWHYELNRTLTFDCCYKMGVTQLTFHRQKLQVNTNQLLQYEAYCQIQQASKVPNSKLILKKTETSLIVLLTQNQQVLHVLAHQSAHLLPLNP